MSTCEQVCDGEVLWTRRDLPGREPYLTRVDVRKVASPADAATGGAIDPLGLGGPAELLRGLEAAFDFQLQPTAQLGEVSVLVLRGQWKTGHLQRLLPDQKTAIEAGSAVDLARLAKVVPDHVWLMLGEDDLFPYRIEFGRTSESSTRAGQGRGAQAPGTNQLVVLEYFEVQFDRPCEREQFLYEPNGKDADDVTDAYLARLKALP